MTDIDWTPSDQAAAAAEGWDIFDCDGSDNGPWQLQCFDNPAEAGWPQGKAYPFGCDPDAWRHVLTRAAAGSPLHQRALQFLEQHSPAEHQRILSLATDPATAMPDISSMVTTTATLEINDDQLEALAEAHLRRKLRLPADAEVSLEWQGTHCPYLHVTIKHERPARTSVGMPDHSDWTDKLDSLFV